MIQNVLKIVVPCDSVNQVDILFDSHFVRWLSFLCLMRPCGCYQCTQLSKQLYQEDTAYHRIL